MKTNAEILIILTKKLEEHIAEVKGANEALEAAKKFGMKDITSATKLLVLKDKIMFHKACLAALDDLRKEIEK